MLLALAILPLTISNDSLWLDEGDTAMYALEPTFHSWCERLLHDGQADCQMPLAMLAAWVGAKTFGSQEWQLRAVNLLWGALAVLALYRVGRRLQMPWLPLLLAIQPYFWFYQNEARPYALQIAGGAWLLVALVEFIQARGDGTAWAWGLSASAVFLFAATMLAPVPVILTGFVGTWLAWRHGWRVERRAWLILAGGFLACVPLAVYYAGTLLRGAKGMQIWSVDLKFFAYVIYELAGMGGLGLSGAEIRGIARSPHVLPELAGHWPQLMLPLTLGALLAVIFYSGLRLGARNERRSLGLGILLVSVLTMAVLAIASLVLQKAFWARHYAPVFPFFVALLGMAFAGIGQTGRMGWRLLLVAVCGLFLWSALRFRFDPSLHKEDYRTAAAYVRPLVVQGKNVWWLAGDYSANYYGLKTTLTQPESGKVFVPFHLPGDVPSLPLPDVVMLAKPDVHDPDGVARKIMDAHQYGLAFRCQGFTAWTNPAAH